MKKHTLIISTVILLLSFFTSACEPSGNVSNADNISTPTETIDSTISHALNDTRVDYEIISKTVCTKEKSDIVNLLIPQIFSKTEHDFTFINQLIYDQTINYLSQFDIDELYLSDEYTQWEWDDNAYKKFALNGDYTIKFNDEKTISIVFFGLWNVKTEPHPNNYSFSINIDLESEQLIDISSIYNFNNDFVELFRLNKEDWILQEEQAKSLDEYFDSLLLSELSDNENTSFYYTENKLGVIIAGLPFAIGNYCTAEIPYEDIEQFKS